MDRRGEDGGAARVVFIAAAAVVVVIVGGMIGIRAMSSGESVPPSTASTSSSPSDATYTSVDDMRSHNPFYVAHRGGSAKWPEMSMQAYENAAELGIGALEVSVARTKDGVFFGLHDKTLDRTSQVTGNIDPATLTWDELNATYRNKLNASTPEGVPYAQVSEIFETFARSHVIFVDPKYIGDPQQRTELIDQMLEAAPAEHWVLKGYYDNAALTKAARDVGIQTWGYYYGRDLPRLAETAPNWDMLGLEQNATPAQWQTVTAQGKPVIAFFISSEVMLEQAMSNGAQGMMVSDVPAVLVGGGKVASATPQ
ncbi:MAG: glycerophosphodiester phosphodiesterase family protein [Candidatus Nanopelagicales bacterium]